MAISKTIGTTGDAFSQALLLSGGATTEVRLQGSLLNTGANPMYVKVTLTSALSTTPAQGTVLLDPGESMDLLENDSLVVVRPPFTQVEVDVSSAVSGNSTTFSLSYSAW